MRPIDADALFKRVQKAKYKEPKGPFQKGINHALTMLKSWLNNECATPTVGTGTAGNASWDEYDCCTACKASVEKRLRRNLELDNEAFGFWYELPPYCPNCGAKMKGCVYE